MDNVKYIRSGKLITSFLMDFGYLIKWRPYLKILGGSLAKNILTHLYIAHTKDLAFKIYL